MKMTMFYLQHQAHAENGSGINRNNSANVICIENIIKTKINKKNKGKYKWLIL